MVQQRFDDVMNSLVKYRNDMRLFVKEAEKHLITGMLRTFYTESRLQRVALERAPC